MFVSSTEESVPRGLRRQQLHELGAVVHSFAFWANWSEGEVRAALEEALGGVNDPAKLAPR